LVLFWVWSLETGDLQGPALCVNRSILMMMSTKGRDT
jgi:hypothetical protein